MESKEADLALVNTDDKDDIFSIVEVHRGMPEVPELRPAANNPAPIASRCCLKQKDKKGTERIGRKLLRNSNDSPASRPL